MTSGSLDTNVVLRLIIEDVPDQCAAAERLVEKSAAGGLKVTDVAIVEVVFALNRYYGFSRKQVTDVVSGLLGLEEVNGDTVLFEEALAQYVDHPALSFEECYLAARSRQDGAEPLWTFDKKLAAQADSARLLV